MPIWNVSEERLLELCSELELVIENMCFRKKGKNKFSWLRLVEREMMDYVIVEKSVLGRLTDMHVVRKAVEGCLITF